MLDAQADAASQGKEGLVRADARALKKVSICPRRRPARLTRPLPPKTRQGFEIDRDALFVDVKRRHDASLYVASTLLLSCLCSGRCYFARTAAATTAATTATATAISTTATATTPPR